MDTKTPFTASTRPGFGKSCNVTYFLGDAASKPDLNGFLLCSRKHHAPFTLLRESPACIGEISCT